MENTAVSQTQNTSISLRIKLALSWWHEWTEHALAVWGIPGQLATFPQPSHGNSLLSKEVVLVSLGCCDTVLSAGWLRTAEPYCLTSREARSAEIKVSVGRALSEALRKLCSRHLSLLLVVPRLVAVELQSSYGTLPGWVSPNFSLLQIHQSE